MTFDIAALHKRLEREVLHPLIRRYYAHFLENHMHDPNENREASAPVPANTFIRPKISGYRQLSPVEVDLMNEAKALGSAFEELVARLRRYHQVQRDNTAAAHPMDGYEEEAQARELKRIDDAEPARWLAMGRTDIQTGVMKIVRSIAQPAS